VSRYLFGKAFVVASPLSVDRAKTAISEATDYMMSPTKRDGFFGWRVGRLFCIWPYVNRLSNRNGPIAVGWIGERAKVAKLYGIAGPDINGTIWFVVILTSLAVADVTSDTLTWEARVWLGAGLFFVMLYSFIRRHEADDLVQFLATTVDCQEAPKLRAFLDTEWEDADPEHLPDTKNGP
jgi:hypothetical protein